MNTLEARISRLQPWRVSKIILWNIGVKISPNIMFPIGFGFLFFISVFFVKMQKGIGLLV
jgi:hypothetical protein